MNYIERLNIVYGFVIEDNRLRSIHIGMYLGLFQLWNKNRFENPVDIVRKEVMLLSRIGSTHSYYKTIKDLHEWVYIEYIPSKNPLRKRSVIEMINDELKNICQVEHSRHRAFSNFLTNTISGLIAYSFFDKKTAI